MTGIYKLVNKATNKVYIGKSRNLKDIWESYNGLLESERATLTEEMRKYGSKNFEFSVLEECKESQLSERENYYISFYKNNMNNMKLKSTKEKIKKGVSLVSSSIKSTPKPKSKRKMNEGLKTHVEKMRTDPEYRAQMVKKYKNNRPNAIAINMLDKVTGAVVRTFPKIMDGATWIRENTDYSKADYATINKICKGQGKTAYGYKWEYVSK